MKKGFLITMVLVLLLGMIPGFGLAEADTSEQLELTMVLLGDEPARMDDVLKEFNKLALEDLNCTLKIKYLDWGEYETKYPLMFSSGEKFDLAYAATWVDFANLAQKGAFMPLEDLLPVYCKESLKNCPEEALEQATMNGHIYAYPTNNKNYSAYGCEVRGDMMDKYGFTDIPDFETYGEFLKAVAQGETQFVNVGGMNYNPSLMANIYLESKGYYPLNGGQFGFLYLDLNAEKPTVFAMHEWEGYEAYLNMMKDWADSGLWPKSVLSITDSVDGMVINGMAAGRMTHAGGWASDYAVCDPSWDIRWFNFVNPVNYQAYTQDAMVIPNSSENPERALMLLDKIRTDERYYDLLTYGVEGVDFIRNENGTFEMLNTDLFPGESGTWGFQTQEFKLISVRAPKDYAATLEKLESLVVPNVFRSFNMDTAPVKTEFAALQNVYSQYNLPLCGGVTNDVHADLQKLIDQANAAGYEKVKEEMQRQVDEFYAAHN